MARPWPFETRPTRFEQATYHAPGTGSKTAPCRVCSTTTGCGRRKTQRPAFGFAARSSPGSGPLTAGMPGLAGNDAGRSRYGAFFLAEWVATQLLKLLRALGPPAIADVLESARLNV